MSVYSETKKLNLQVCAGRQYESKVGMVDPATNNETLYIERLITECNAEWLLQKK